jgi:hypothetical protein
LEFRSEPFLRRGKLSKFRSEPFSDERNLRILLNPCRKRKILRLPLQNILRREKISEFRSEPFLEEKNFGIPF